MSLGPNVPGWSAVILLDGEPVTGPVPFTPWEAASPLARLVAGITGGPVSVAGAVLNDPDDHDLHVSAAPCDTCETRQQCRDAGRCLVPAGEAALAAEPAPQLDIFDALTTTGSNP